MNYSARSSISIDFFDNLRALTSKLANPCGDPTHATTCVQLRYRLARALELRNLDEFVEISQLLFDSV